MTAGVHLRGRVVLRECRAVRSVAPTWSTYPTVRQSSPRAGLPRCRRGDCDPPRAPAEGQIEPQDRMEHEHRYRRVAIPTARVRRRVRRSQRRPGPPGQTQTDRQRRAVRRARRRSAAVCAPASRLAPPAPSGARVVAPGGGRRSRQPSRSSARRQYPSESEPNHVGEARSRHRPRGLRSRCARAMRDAGAVRRRREVRRDGHRSASALVLRGGATLERPHDALRHQARSALSRLANCAACDARNSRHRKRRRPASPREEAQGVSRPGRSRCRDPDQLRDHDVDLWSDTVDGGAAPPRRPRRGARAIFCFATAERTSGRGRAHCRTPPWRWRAAGRTGAHDR